MTNDNMLKSIFDHKLDEWKCDEYTSNNIWSMNCQRTINRLDSEIVMCSNLIEKINCKIRLINESNVQMSKTQIKQVQKLSYKKHQILGFCEKARSEKGKIIELISWSTNNINMPHYISKKVKLLEDEVSKLINN